MGLHIVLFEPAIIQNVGNIARTCLAFHAELHLIRPYGFIFNKSKLNRSSTNHFEKIKYHEYNSFADFLQSQEPQYLYFYTRYGTQTPSDLKYPNIRDHDIYLVFGNENYGIEKKILKAYPNQLVRIPMSSELICLNISNSVAIAAYEVVKQMNYSDLELREIFKKDW